MTAPREFRTFFTTAITANRRRIFQAEANAKLLIQLLYEHRTKSRYQLHAYVVMPDHIHLLLTPASDVTIAKAMQLIKGGFSFRFQSKLPVWQQSFTLHRVENGRDFATHHNYIHANPIRAQICDHPDEFPYSSAYPAVLIDPVPTHLNQSVRRTPGKSPRH
jgi:putative transposase